MLLSAVAVVRVQLKGLAELGSLKTDSGESEGDRRISYVGERKRNHSNGKSLGGCEFRSICQLDPLRRVCHSCQFVCHCFLVQYHGNYSLHQWLHSEDWLSELEASLSLDEEAVRRIGDDRTGGPAVSRQLRLVRMMMRDLLIGVRRLPLPEESSINF